MGIREPRPGYGLSMSRIVLDPKEDHMPRFYEVIYNLDLRDIQDDVVAFVKETLKPDDVFEEADLRKWALANGFTESE